MKGASLKTREFFYKFGKKWNDFWSTKEILKKFLYTLLLLAIYLIMTSIKSPFVSFANIRGIDGDTFLSTLNLIGGGGLRQFSLVALGISPFINASLIMSLLQTRAFPAVMKLSQSGPEGRRKINIITRVLTIVLAFPQSFMLTKALSAGDNPFIKINTYGMNIDLVSYFLLPLILIGGSLFSLFIAEQITNKGIGNGTSLIIFVGIAFQLPTQFQTAWGFYLSESATSAAVVGAFKFLTYLFVYLLLLFVITMVYLAERHIPIQQIGAGRSKNIKDMGKLPIKLNPAGVMPMIFASMIVSLPMLIARILPKSNTGGLWIRENMDFSQPLGLTLLVVFTFFFTFIMGLQQSRVDKIAEDFAKNSTFIPGIQPGEQTEDYLIGIVMRLSLFSSFYLVLLVSFQYLMIIILSVPTAMAFGGTGMMILASVSLETIDQFKARIKSSQLSKQKRISRMVSENISEQKTNSDTLSNNNNIIKKNVNLPNNEDGLLW
ncbi:preprotein translocase subunit SecY [Mycoplasma sp. 1331]|uniref:Protein translocase subunit SecY n=1 Tax=Mycoplasma tauri TaxID=547987 RepID=A0A953T3Y3_9MOLU|nr:preprotein translocase subunit SecY [Mycoplasma tauri]MBZ4195583.1 preprotein translocase subunit SecY [Mycoplasma tauri]